MKKKISLTDLLMDADTSQLTEILQNLITTNPSIEDQIRIFLQPRNSIDNPVSYYKKLIKSSIPRIVRSLSDVKVIKDSIKPLLDITVQLTNSKNHYEANKVYALILDTILPRANYSPAKGMAQFAESILDLYAKSLNNISDNTQLIKSLKYVTKIDDNKAFNFKTQPKSSIIDWSEDDFDDLDEELGISRKELMSNIQDTFSQLYFGNTERDSKPLYYYLFLEKVAKEGTQEIILDEIEAIINKSKTPSPSTIAARLYVFKNRHQTKEFLKLAADNAGDEDVYTILVAHYEEAQNYKQALKERIKYLKANFQYFESRSDDEYNIAIEFLTLIKSPNYVKMINKEIHKDIQEVLINIICTGNRYTAYDVSPKAKWWAHYNQLKTEYPTEWSDNYKAITLKLETCELTKQLLAIITHEKDAQYALFNLLDHNDNKIKYLACQICAHKYPTEVLPVLIKFFRYSANYGYYHEHKYDEFEAMSIDLKMGLNPILLPQLLELEMKVKKNFGIKD